MALPAILPLIGVAAQFLGPIIGSIAAGDDRRKAQEAINVALAEIERVDAPPDLSKEIILEKFRQVGVYSPKLESQLLELPDTAFNEIKEDKRLREAQIKALSALEERGRVGLTPEEKAELGKLRRDVSSQAEGRRQAILQNMAARGQAGSGAELAAQLASSQEATQRAAEGSEQAAGMASKRALEAILAGGQLGGSIRGQDYAIASDKARAQDIIKQFNVSQAIEREKRNIERENEAAIRNLTEAQRIADMNVQQGNLEKARQAQAQIDFWRNKLELARIKSGNLAQKAGVYQSQGDQTAQAWSSASSGLGSGLIGLSGLYQQQQEQNRAKST